MERTRGEGQGEQGRMDRTAVAVLSVAHFISDSYSSTIYPLLPLLAAKLHLTELQVFFLVPTLSITSAFMQPVYGVIADRYTRRMFAVLGPAVTGCFFSLIGVAPSFWMLLALLVCGGLGVGAFHPQAVSLAAEAGGNRRRFSVSLFSSMGTLGFATGPLMIALVVGAAGLSKTPYMIGSGVLASLLLYLYGPASRQSLSTVGQQRQSVGLGLRALKTVRGSLAILFIISLSRSAVYLLLGNYLPFILRDEGYSLKATGGALTIYMLTGALGSFAGGGVAGWVGERTLNVISGVLTTVFLISACLVHGPLGMAILALGTCALLSIIPVNITQAQALAPGQTSTVSALLMGLAWGTGSLAVPTIGPMATTLGFRPVLMFMAVLPLLTGFLALALPKEREPAVKGMKDVSLSVTPSGD
ncbi:MAG: MFS transporter [Acidobacteria bacterium]|nr:MFS transporter [Acidobacteriota bacterium]